MFSGFVVLMIPTCEPKMRAKLHLSFENHAIAFSTGWGLKIDDFKNRFFRLFFDFDVFFVFPEHPGAVLSK